MLKTLRNLIDPTERELRRLQSTVDIINKLEPEMRPQ